MKYTRTLAIAAALLVSLPLFAEDYRAVLQNGSIDARIDAMYQLGYAANKEAFWDMVKYLDFKFENQDDSDLSVRCRLAAAESLGRLKDERAVPYLVKRYGVEPSGKVKAKIIFALSFYKTKDVLPVIQNGLESANEDILFESIRAAALYKNPALCPKLKQILTETKNPVIKLTADFALLETNDDATSHAAALKTALADKDPLIRFLAAQYLGRSNRLDAIPSVVKALEIENQFWVQTEMETCFMALKMKKRKLDEDRDAGVYDFVTGNTPAARRSLAAPNAPADAGAAAAPAAAPQAP